MGSSCDIWSYKWRWFISSADGWCDDWWTVIGRGVGVLWQEMVRDLEFGEVIEDWGPQEMGWTQSGVWGHEWHYLV